jgi:hypothetical protein
MALISGIPLLPFGWPPAPPGAASSQSVLSSTAGPNSNYKIKKEPFTFTHHTPEDVKIWAPDENRELPSLSYLPIH